MPSGRLRSSAGEPSSAIFPLSRTIIRFMWCRVERRWATAMTVLSLIRFCRAFSIRDSDWLSSAEVASSRMSTGAFCKMARAIAIRCLSPPESKMPRSPTTLSDVIIQIEFGSSLLWETSGSAGSDIILFVIEAYMGGLFLLTNLFILYESKIISTILILWLWGLLMLIVLSASILLAFIPGYAIGIFIEYRVKRKI